MYDTNVLLQQYSNHAVNIHAHGKPDPDFWLSSMLVSNEPFYTFLSATVSSTAAGQYHSIIQRL